MSLILFCTCSLQGHTSQSLRLARWVKRVERHVERILKSLDDLAICMVACVPPCKVQPLQLGEIGNGLISLIKLDWHVD